MPRETGLHVFRVESYPVRQERHAVSQTSLLYRLFGLHAVMLFDVAAYMVSSQAMSESNEARTLPPTDS